MFSKHSLRYFLVILLLVLPSSAFGQFSFVVVSDQRRFAGSGVYDSSDYFRGAVEAILQTGKGAFLISPGDIDPVQSSYWTIQQVVGTEYQWFPVVGNHELPGEGVEAYWGENLNWLRNFNTDINGTGIEPDLVSPGPSGCPETTYSFDYQNSHFVILNEYCDADGDDVTSGDISDHLYQWLQGDLLATNKENIFVVGHAPAFPQPDLDNGRFRYEGGGISGNPASRDRFWDLLKQQGVKAYFCGHTHNFSAVKIDGVWQLDSGHARGQGDLGAASTYLRLYVGDDGVISYNSYRDIHDGNYDYTDIIHSGTLAGRSFSRTLSFQNGLVPTSAYSGTKDTTIAESSPYQNFGDLAALYADGDDPPASGSDLSALLYWDVSSVPQGSIVNGVSITLNITDVTSGDYRFYAISRPWLEHQADWHRATYGQRWEVPGANGGSDRGSTLLGAYSFGRRGFFSFDLNVKGIEQIQSWIDDPTANNGVIITNSLAANGVNFSSSNAVEPEKRPKLTITYSYLPELKALPWLNLLFAQ